MTSFIEKRLLEKVAYGTESGPSYSTRVVSLKNGYTRRNSDWSSSLDRFSIVYSFLRPADRELVVRAFRACRGRAVGFRFKDPLDHDATDEFLAFGTGDVQTLRLRKSYDFGGVVEIKEISKPVSVVVSVDGEPVTVSVDMNTGYFEITADADSVITWSGVFDKPVCFSDDRLSWSLDAKEGGVTRLASTSVDLEEIRM